MMMETERAGTGYGVFDEDDNDDEDDDCDVQTDDCDVQIYIQREGWHALRCFDCANGARELAQLTYALTMMMMSARERELAHIAVSLMMNLFLKIKIMRFIIKAKASNTIPKLNAIESSPLEVSSTILVVITLVRFATLPPTIITAPTSDNARPSDTNNITISSNLCS